MLPVIQDTIFEDLTNIGIPKTEIEKLIRELKPHIPKDVNERSYESTLNFHRGQIGRRLLVTYALREVLENVEWIDTYLKTLVDDIVRAAKISERKPVVVSITHDLEDIYFVFDKGGIRGKVYYDYTYSRKWPGYRISQRISVNGEEEFVRKFKNITKIQ